MSIEGTITEGALRLELAGLAAEHALARQLIHCRPAERVRLVQGAGRAMGKIRVLLAGPAHTEPEFRRKLQAVARRMQRIAELGRRNRLASLQQHADAVVEGLAGALAQHAPNGDDLLPLAADLESVATELQIISELCGIALPGLAERTGETTVARSRTGALAQALHQRAEQLAREFGRQVTLNTSGLSSVPADWHSAVFDIASQLLRNAVEHGIEAPGDRLAGHKPPGGEVQIKFSCEAGLCRLVVADDGAGLDAARIAELAFKHGGLTTKPGKTDARQIARMIFLRGLSTAANPEGRGLGMNIVRDQLRRLGGKISVATRSGQYTRIEMELPAVPQVEAATPEKGETQVA